MKENYIYEKIYFFNRKSMLTDKMDKVHKIMHQRILDKMKTDKAAAVAASKARFQKINETKESYFDLLIKYISCRLNKL